MKVEGKSITKLYQSKNGRFHGINQADLTVQGGKIILLQGRSGSGKTTFIQILQGLLKPDAGSVYVDGADFSHFTEEESQIFRNENIGYIPQNPAFIETFTVGENLRIAYDLFHADFQKGIERLKIYLNALDLENLENESLSHLSGGEKRRIAIARGFMQNPKILFADEPTNDLDNENTERIMKLFQEKARAGMGILVVSHDPLVKKYADETYVLSDGRIEKKEN